MSDARAAAWLTAWDCLKQAVQLQEAATKSQKSAAHKAAYREAMADFITLADRFTALVNAPEIVGAVCAIDLENRRDAREEQERMTADMAEAFKKAHEETQ